MIKCVGPGCDAQIKNNAWAKTRAQTAGWFFSFNGREVYCPKHVPEWVGPWRAKNKAKGKK